MPTAIDYRPPDPVITPGARVVIRDAEWIVRRVDNAPKGFQLVCDGVSELVQGREAIFLTALEPPIQILDPANTELVPDGSARFSDSILYMESQLRQAVPSDAGLHVGHTAAMDAVPYQLEPARLALAQPRQRILIADAVGLGKTMEAGILVSELIARGRGRRILVLAVKSMLAQFQKEFWNRFTIPLTRLDSIGIQRVRSRIPTNHNPFHYYDKSIISIDTLKQDTEYRTYLEQAYWDIIVIDEAHNVADRGTGSLRSRLAKLLARRSDTLIMLSATPHDGKAKSFASLVNMLDATAIADPDDYSQEDFRPGLVIRRFKKDVQDQVREAFQDRQVSTRRFPASQVEEAAYLALLDVRIAAGTGSANRRDLFLVSLEKALFSSPAACKETAAERIKRRERELGDGNADRPRTVEIESLRRLREALARIEPAAYAKYQALLAAIRDGRPFRWRPTDPSDRLVVFTERIATLNWLEGHLVDDLNLAPGQLETLHGGMSDVEQQRIVEDFGNAQRPVRLLICSDVAAEGINLHYHCHRLIHFDLPWSLMVFQQRNGRVDRYGQTATPHIAYLVTESAAPTIRGDTRILEVLIEKDEQAYKNIGDPSVFMDVHDVDEEQRITEAAVAAGESAEDFDRRLTATPSEGDDLLRMFLQPDTEAPVEGPDKAPPPPPLSLFASDLHYCEAALHRLRSRQVRATAPGAGERSPGRAVNLRFEVNRDTRTLTLDAPPDLVARYSHLPPEVLPVHRRLVLTTSRARMAEAVEESRRAESAWPSLHYLWRLSPVVTWLNDRMLAAFGRHQAPILADVPGLSPYENAFVLSGLVPNRKSHPLVYDWIAVAFRSGEDPRLIPFDELLERTGLGPESLANRQAAVDVDAVSALLPAAVTQARRYFVDRRNAFEEAINAKLDDEIRALDEFRARRVEQVEAALGQSKQGEQFKLGRRDRVRRDTDDIHDRYLKWIEDTMTTEPRPWIKVICVMTAPASAKGQVARS